MPSLPKIYQKSRWDFLSLEKNGTLQIEGLSVQDIAKKYGTPVYVLAERSIRERFRDFKKSFPYPKLRVQYATKCNSNLEIMRIANEEGIELDASSVGEIILALLADFAPLEITFTNPNKSEQDVIFAARLGIQAITADSFEDLQLIESAGKKLRKKIRIFCRITPLIETGDYSTRRLQFGVPYAQYKRAMDMAMKSKHLELIGLHFHGPYIYNPRIYFHAAKKLFSVAEYLLREYNHKIRFIDLGGSFPIAHGEIQDVFHPRDMGRAFTNFFIKQAYKINLPLPYMVFEPGKFFVANAGVGLTKVISKKRANRINTLIVDGSTYAFLPDPLVYHCLYDILPATRMNIRRTCHYQIAGCTCDNIDIITRNAYLPTIETGDLLAVMDCGAYSNTMASNFNSLKRAPMVMVNQHGVPRLIRRRDRYSDMFAPELDVLKVADPQELKRYYDLWRVSLEKLWGGKKKKNGIQKAKSAPTFLNQKINN
ncbi:diaminopimelate decarboxylase [Candidatus Uhrbacteria bacterium]|nr:diaminopimelate decarboxylase [Candidatus Uhrbacteria bacterium]